MGTDLPGVGGEDRDAGIAPAWKRDSEQRGREGRDVTVRSQRSQSLLLFLASLCVSKVTGKAEESTSLHTELHKRPQNRNHVTDRHRYCVHDVFTGNTRALMNHFCGCAPRLSSHMSPLTPDHDLDPPASLVTQSDRYRAYY